MNYSMSQQLSIKLIYIGSTLTGLLLLSCNGNRIPEAKKSITPLTEEGPREDHAIPSVGLNNLGNTCFANSSINLLFSATMVQEALMSRPKKKSMESDEHFVARSLFHQAAKDLFLVRQKNQPLCKELNAFFDSYENTRKIINGSELIGSVDKIRKDQADAAEFMNDILDFLDIEGPNLFHYHKFLDNKTNMSSIETQKMLFISINKNTMKDNIAQLLEPELITGENQVVNSEGFKMDAYRYDLIANPLPRSLIIHLGRFSQDMKTGTPIRLGDVVVPDKQLEIVAHDYSDLNKIYSQSYILKGVIVHLGSSPHSGHYVAYIFDSSNKKWINFDDNRVSEVSETEMEAQTSKNGYVFLYEKI